MQTPILNPRLPYIGPVTGGKFEPQQMVRIQGSVPSVAYRFNINLQCGTYTHPQSDIAVQVSVRLLDNYVALNSLEKGIWGDELRKATSPIQNGQNFEIIILCNLEHYMVAINGQHYSEFPRRIHHNRISHLGIIGDVLISKISYESGFIGASAPKLTPPAEENHDFELVDSSDAPLLRQPSPTTLPRDSQPPTYGIVVPDYNRMQPKSFAPAPHTSSGVPPYPVPSMPPYYGGGPAGPIALGHPPGPGIYPPPPPGIHVPPPSATIPLNAPSSQLQPVNKTINAKKCCTYCWAVVIGIIFIIGIVVGKTEQSSNRY